MVLLISDDRMIEHDPGPLHPEAPARLRAVLDALSSKSDLSWREPQPATHSHVARVHTPEHIARIDALRGREGYLDPDTSVSAASVQAAYLAAGALVDSVTATVNGESAEVFALVRPPGHHAEADAAMGFCLFNNVAIAAEHALTEQGCARVLIVDWDVHHGNGTQNSFYARRDVMYFSMHQSPFYPGSGGLEEVGTGAGRGFTVNVPFPAGLGDGDHLSALHELLVPMANAFEPDLVLVSAGFDAHRDDPLGSMQLSDRGFGAMTAVMQGIATRHCEGRLVLALEGGYDLGALGRSVCACIETLQGANPGAVDGASETGKQLITEVARLHHGLLL